LQTPVPFLMPKEDSNQEEAGSGGTHIVLPPEKENRKIRFQEEILVTEIENRFYLNDFPEDDEEGSYEIEIVEDDGDADFYLEIVDGEVFYVFETEDDISLESAGSDDNNAESKAGAEDDITNQLNASMFLNVDNMMFAPDLDESDGGRESDLPMEISIQPDSATMESFNQASQFLELDDFMESSDEEEKETYPQNDDEPQKPNEPVFESEEKVVGSKGSRTESDDTLVVVEDEEASLDVGVPVGEPLVKEAAEETVAVLPIDTKPEQVLMTEGSRTASIEQSEHTSQSNPSFAATPTSSPVTPKTKSILRSNPTSPIKTPTKDRGTKKKTTKTFSKTYVRADELDGEHRVYSWAKPDWTKERKLRETGRADALRKGKLEAPITFFPKKPVNEGLENDDEVEEMVKKAMSNAPKSVSIFGTRKNLRVSVNGSRLREGADIVKPITQATVRQKPEINKVANPGVLKPTQTGELVRKGGTLAAPVTFPKKKMDGTNRVANKEILRRKVIAPQPKKQYEWSKPDWTKEPKLRHTAVGDAVKQGADLQGPITQAPHVRRKSSDTLSNMSFSSSGSSEDARSDEAVVWPRRGGRRVPPRAASMPSSSNHSKDRNPYLAAREVESIRGDKTKQEEEKKRQEQLARLAQQWADEDDHSFG
jgi:hypothetical protein